MESKDLDQAHDLLVKQVLNDQTLTYREFAFALEITEAPVINKCTTILEKLMHEDAKNRRPILSAMVIQQGSLAIPRSGFYQILNRLNLYQGDEQGAEAIHWHQMEMNKLKKYYNSEHNEK